MAADPKPRSDPRRERRTFRRKANVAEWRALHAAKQGPCRVCGLSVHGTNLHHLVRRSAGGDDTFDNLVPLCGDGTSGCHGAVHAYRPLALNTLARNLSDAEYAYCIGKLGEGAMERLFGVGVVSPAGREQA